jgi:hypothetical protein
MTGFYPGVTGRLDTPENIGILSIKTSYRFGVRRMQRKYGCGDGGDVRGDSEYPSADEGDEGGGGGVQQDVRHVKAPAAPGTQRKVQSERVV